LLAIAMAASVVLAGCGHDNTEAVHPKVKGSLPTQGALLFIVRGPTDVSDGRMEIDTDAAEWFIDRPDRRAGAAPIGDLVHGWGSLGFAADPPNAAVSGTDEFTTVELSDPRLDGDQVSFAFQLLKGKLPSGDQGFLSVFIDAGIGSPLNAHKDNPTLGQHKDNPTVPPDVGAHKDNPTLDQQ
jgi:hypothetical protein